MNTSKLTDLLIMKGLSNEQAKIACLVTQGLSNKEISNQLFITERAVKIRLASVYKKMHVTSRAQLIVYNLCCIDESVAAEYSALSRKIQEELSKPTKT